MKTITATVHASLLGSCFTLDQVQRMKPEHAVSAVGLSSPSLPIPADWVKVGSAEVTITFDDPAEVTENQIASLRAAKKKVQADCEIALMQLDGQIQSLLAIEAPKVAE
jgi:hypothetical protein